MALAHSDAESAILAFGEGLTYLNDSILRLYLHTSAADWLQISAQTSAQLQSSLEPRIPMYVIGG
jgi:hypothetical protein